MGAAEHAPVSQSGVNQDMASSRIAVVHSLMAYSEVQSMERSRISECLHDRRLCSGLELVRQAALAAVLAVLVEGHLECVVRES